ncbi:MAG: hypothetical protein ACRDBO_12720 [Lachnospiraceae bacterium]
MEFMDNIFTTYKNFVFIGEAGSGKSEIAINYAISLQKWSGKRVHFFDMDMTKPLFRSRDFAAQLKAEGIEFHYEEQFMDAPTLVGGVRRLLKDPDCYVVMDIGGDYIGARAIGGFAPELNKENCMIYYVLNPYRPWSLDIEHIDQVLGAVLGTSHIHLDQLHLISNPNIGSDTGEQEVTEGHKRLEQMVAPYRPITFTCVKEELYEAVKEKLTLPVMPLHLYVTYPWNADQEDESAMQQTV